MCLYILGSRSWRARARARARLLARSMPRPGIPPRPRPPPIALFLAPRVKTEEETEETKPVAAATAAEDPGAEALGPGAKFESLSSVLASVEDLPAPLSDDDTLEADTQQLAQPEADLEAESFIQFAEPEALGPVQEATHLPETAAVDVDGERICFDVQGMELAWYACADN